MQEDRVALAVKVTESELEIFSKCDRFKLQDVVDGHTMEVGLPSAAADIVLSFCARQKHADRCLDFLDSTWFVQTCFCCSVFAGFCHFLQRTEAC